MVIIPVPGGISRAEFDARTWAVPATTRLARLATGLLNAPGDGDAGTAFAGSQDAPDPPDIPDAAKQPAPPPGPVPRHRRRRLPVDADDVDEPSVPRALRNTIDRLIGDLVETRDDDRQ